MKIKFLGTGAADWPLTNKDNTKEYRRFSAAIIDNELLIDCGPQIMEALKEHNVDPSNIKYVINTHNHRDHFSEDSLKQLNDFGAEFVQIKAGEEAVLGKYTVYAFACNHGTCQNAVHFIIKDSKHTVFYGLDGAWLMIDEVQGIKTHKPDLAVLDATIGFVDGDYRIFEHNNLNMVLEIQKTLKPFVKQFCISHMARTLHTSHKELQEKLQSQNILAAYDGMEIDLDYQNN